ncbi:molybdopterin-dependent oxidoreductase [Caloramator sp. Dgby_cultured_2]|uniref:molybdopterin-dependent oxidoreductase n=1 Tax=Caloramator sp. Dgby_cultured_2 TaxID=3029174 RepID=UPI00237ED15A|nr:molybdopterin-dependent oxidoreductase [Caloramator sp. Dgby_cultured_2]WDU84438.1 molybdopterin-dependent oxidoreductase [Caloramator sp. Dgby_cultured_2]
MDPVKTKTAKEADYFIQIMPGQDQLLALGLVNYLIKNKMIDEEFIDKYTYGFEEFKTYVEKLDLKTVATICKINEEEIIKLARLIWENRPLSLICGLGLQRRINGGQTIRAIGLIPALVGSVGIEGGGFRYANLSEPKLKWPF